MKLSESRTILEGLDKFDSNLQKFNRISPNDKMTNNIATMYLRSATHTNKDLLAAWVQCETMHEMMNKPTPTYEEFYAFLLKVAKKMEDAITDNSTTRKANSATSDYLSPYSASDDHYDDATDLCAYMGDRGDVDMIQDILQCNKAMNEGKLRPPSRSRRRPPPREDLKIQQPAWGETDAEFKKAWIRASNETKEAIVAQFSGKPKATGPAVKRT